MQILRRRTTARALAVINLTPLLDVMCNLLITFMIVAPTLKSGITINLPQVEDTPKLTQEHKSFTITIAKPLTPEGAPRVYLEDRTLNLDEMRAGLKDLKNRFGNDFDVVIESDRTVPCETMLQMLNLTKEVGIESVGVVTTPPEPEKKK